MIEEEGDRKGGFGSDLSVEKLGTEGIDKTRRGGIESGIDKGRNCRVDVAVENCVGVGGVKSIDMIRESHMNICLRSVLDKRRIGSSLHFQLCSSLISQIGRSVKLNGRAQFPVDFCRTSAYNHKKVRFANHNQFNDNSNNNNNGCGGDNDGEVGLCNSILNVRGLRQFSIQTQQRQ